MKATKHQLPNGCACSQLSVFPKNWKTAIANAAIKWYISYRFYDPQQPRPKQVIIKGMNQFSTLAEKRDATRQLLEDEWHMLKDKGFNPFTKTFAAIDHSEIEGETPLLEALQRVKEGMDIDPLTKKDIGYYVAGFGAAARELGLDRLAIAEVKRKHIRAILKRCKERKGNKWTANQHNVYRKYLIILFKELMELEAIGADPVSGIKRMRTIQRPRQVLTETERTKVNELLRGKYYPFWRFLQIFFHSGSRIRELMRLKASDCDLENQQYKCLVKKGRDFKEVWKPIKDIVLPLWKEQIELTSTRAEYLFTRDLLPGLEMVRADQITKRWYRLVKLKLGIQADFYSLKHLNTTEVTQLLSEEAAAKLNGHTSTAMVVQIYDINNKKRKDEELKKVANPFA